MKIREEIKREIDGLLQDFDTRWVQRFDELLLQQTALFDGRNDTGRPDLNDSNAQLALPVFTPQVYLADFVSDPQTLLEFRNEAFPQLQRFDQRESYIRAGSRLLTAYDWQHCVALLRHPSMRSWMSTEKSGILWVDTYQSHKLDWASVFSTRLADDCARLDYSMALAHFCQGHSTGNAITTAAILIQSLISKSISLHHEQFTVRTVELTQQHFQDAQNDVEELWALFLEILEVAAKGKCVWIVVDHVDILQQETNRKGLENALALLRNLNALADDPAITVKILIAARIRDAARLSTKIAEARILASRHAIITVPRGHHRNEATLLKSSKKISRLPEPNVSLNFLRASHTAKRKPETATAPKEVDDDTGESDSASLFDPFASSDDSEPTTRSKKAAQHSCSSEDSADEYFSQTRPFGDFAKEIGWESTDDEDHLRKQAISPLTPKIVVAFSEHSPRSGASRSGSDKDGVNAGANEMQAQPDLSTPKAADSGSMSQIHNSLPNDSDSDGAFV
ncbi:hypothetical protein HO133_008838 [Letharia lupina]|uniref:Nephrocystin 3-like N-terminal domain-containing protein n=1 Tax=Letharia lupina TaxID=560253 RepID=A0A8H6CQ19_9LECA|nr:uncharacterized protein HO133_008838 [Letharia lupina]KAF6227394.1 hypothetical protein HO133_008838 [Letharia lupina]